MQQQVLIGGVDYMEVGAQWKNGDVTTQQIDMANEDDMQMIRDWIKRGIRIDAFWKLAVRLPTGQLWIYTPTGGWTKRY